MKKRIEITHKIDGLFDGCVEEELAGLDLAASANKFGEMVADEIIKSLVDANTTVEVNWPVEPNMRAFSVTVSENGTLILDQDDAILATCDEISGQVFNNWNWLVMESK